MALGHAEEVFDDDQPYNGITQELEAFVVGRCNTPVFVIEGLVGQGLPEVAFIPERVTEAFFQFFESRPGEGLAQDPNFLKSRQALVPPKPQEFERAYWISTFRA